MFADSNEQTKCNESGKQCFTKQKLRLVFELCDPESTGFISLDRIIRIAAEHCEDRQDVETVLRQMFAAESSNKLRFPAFCHGVRAVLTGGTTMKHSVETSVFAGTPPAVTPHFVLTPSTENGNQSADDVDSALGGSTSPDINGKSQCSSLSDGENFECFGEETPGGRNSSPNSLARNSWLRTSLRRTASSHQEPLPNRRWGSFRHTGKRFGSNALASQLYRSSSFNSSGRSSTCDVTADEVYSDVSLEEDVLDLNHKVQMLQQQVSVLADHQTNSEDRYTRAKQDSAALQARVLMLEEQLREVELRSEERLQDEQRRNKELMLRVEREKQLVIENCNMRLQSVEKEDSVLREESMRLKSQVSQLRSDKATVEEKLKDSESVVSVLREENQHLLESERLANDLRSRDHNLNTQLVEDLSKELDRLQADRSHTDQDSTITELQKQVMNLRQENQGLKVEREELQSQLLTKGLEEGRQLLHSGSLAAELEAMTSTQQEKEEHNSLEKLKTALKEQQEVNIQLRSYIDGILLNIVENYPQLLEVKHSNNHYRRH